MAVFAIREAKLHDCGAMLRRLREGHRTAIASLGFNAHRELRDRFEASHFRKVWTIDGEMAALGGVSGQALSGTGYIWLAVSQAAMRHPVAMVREARRQIDHLMLTRHELVTNIVPDDERSLKFAMYLGFELIHNAKVKVGSGHVIAMRYARQIARAA
jgi:hypothetical protein